MVLYYPGRALCRIFFSSAFDHCHAAKTYYDSFVKKTAKGGNVQYLIFELVDYLGAEVHLCSDGNGRAATLLGWLLSIIHNKNFPIPVEQRFDKISFQEAVEWVGKFIKNPSCEVRNNDAVKNLRALTTQNSQEFIEKNLAVAFLLDLAKEKFSEDVQNVCMTTPWQNRQEIFLYKMEGDIIISDQAISTKKVSLIEDKISPKYLYAALEKNRDKILSEKNSQRQFLSIAFFFLTEVSEALGEAVSTADYNFALMVMEVYEQYFDLGEDGNYEKVRELMQRVRSKSEGESASEASSSDEEEYQIKQGAVVDNAKAIALASECERQEYTH